MAALLEIDAADKKALGQDIVDAWIQDNLDREDWLADLSRWLWAYQGRVEEKTLPFPGASNLHVPLTGTHIDAIHPRLMAAMTQPEPICSFKAQEPSDEARATKMEKFLDWAVREEVPLFPILDRAILGTLIYGLQFCKVTWELKTRNLRDTHEFPDTMLPQEVIQAVVAGEQQFVEAVQRVDRAAADQVTKNRQIVLEVTHRPGQQPGLGKLLVTTEREEVVRDAPRVTLVDAEDVAVNVDAPYDVQDAHHLLHRYWMTVDEIRRAVRRGTFEASKQELEDLENLASTEVASSDNTRTVKDRRDDVTGVNAAFREGDPSRLELIDAYWPYDVNDDGEDEECVITVVKDRPDLVLRVVRLETLYRHGLRPFVVFHLYPVGGTFWAIGVPQLLDGIQQEINIIHNHRNDAGFIDNTPWGWYKPSAGLNPERLPVEPGYLNPVDDVNQVKMHQPSNRQAWGFQEEAGLLAMAERRTKVSDLTLGRVGETQGAARTASGVQALASQQATGFDILIRRTQEGMKRLLQQILGLYAQYMPPGREVRVLGKYPEDADVLIGRDDLQGQMDLRFSGNSLNTDVEIQRQALTFLMQGPLNPQAITFLMQLGVMQPPGVGELYRYLAELFSVPGRERIFKVPPDAQLLTPEVIINRTIGGERLTPQPGENHQAVIQGLTSILNSPDAMGLTPESIMAMREQLERRQQQAALDAWLQQMQAMLAPPPQPPAMPAPTGPAAAPAPGVERPPVFAR